jgi:hypothetical protein
VSELFGNSLRHSRSGAAGETVTVAVRAGDGFVRVEVTDRSGPGCHSCGRLVPMRRAARRKLVTVQAAAPVQQRAQRNFAAGNQPAPLAKRRHGDQPPGLLSVVLSRLARPPHPQTSPRGSRRVRHVPSGVVTLAGCGSAGLSRATAPRVSGDRQRSRLGRCPRLGGRRRVHRHRRMTLG